MEKNEDLKEKDIENNVENEDIIEKELDVENEGIIEDKSKIENNKIDKVKEKFINLKGKIDKNKINQFKDKIKESKININNDNGDNDNENNLKLIFKKFKSKFIIIILGILILLLFLSFFSSTPYSEQPEVKNMITIIERTSVTPQQILDDLRIYERKDEYKTEFKEEVSNFFNLFKERKIREAKNLVSDNFLLIYPKIEFNSNDIEFRNKVFDSVEDFELEIARYGWNEVRRTISKETRITSSSNNNLNNEAVMVLEKDRYINYDEFEIKELDIYLTDNSKKILVSGLGEFLLRVINYDYLMKDYFESLIEKDILFTMSYKKGNDNWELENAIITIERENIIYNQAISDIEYYKERF